MNSNLKALVLAVGALSLAACTTQNHSMSTSGPSPVEAGDSGRGAPALGGRGDRSNASVAAARGSAHTGRTDSTHSNALNRETGESKPSPSPGKE